MYTVLEVGKNVSILGEKGKLYAMFLNRIYDIETWKCVSDPQIRAMSQNQRLEVYELLPKIQDKLEELADDKKEAPTPEPKKSNLGDELERIMLETLAKTSVDRIMESAKPICPIVTPFRPGPRGPRGGAATRAPVRP